MRSLIIIVTAVILTTNAIAINPPWVGPGCVVDIPVVMDIQPVASIALNNAVIKLEPVGVPQLPPNTLDYAGVTLPPNQPVLTCNVPVTVSAQTEGVAPLVSILWSTALQGQPWSVAGNPGAPSAIDVDPAATPFILDVAVLASGVDMTVRPQGLNARVATTTVTVVPRP